MHNDNEMTQKRGYIRKRKKTQKLLIIMLVIFFFLALGFGTLSVMLTMKVHRMEEHIAGLKTELQEERQKLEDYIFQDQPVGAGDGQEEGSTPTGTPTPVPATEPSPTPTPTPIPTLTPTPTPEPTTEMISTEEDTGEEGTTQGDAMEDTTAAEENPTEPASEEERQGIWADKEVYLTFDDGPSKYTDDILDLLAEYDAKATFFVLGRTDDYSKEMYRRIVDEGHTLAVHSYTHVYKQIYASAEAFAADFMKLSDLLYDVTGVRPTISRFPGGSSNKQTKIGIEPFVRYLNEEGIVYFDWNVENGDATGKGYTAEELTKHTLDGVAKFKRPVVLMHDTDSKKATVESLPVVLETIKENGAEMLALDETVPPVQHVKWNSFD